MKFKIALTFIFFFFCSGMLLQAQKTMTGTVVDANGFVLQGVIISVKETNQTTQTDRNGKFELRIAEKDTSNIICSYIGNGKFELRIAEKDTINIICSYIGYETLKKQLNLNKDNIQNLLFLMKENSSVLEEIIITAEKKETKLQKTPIAVSALSSKEMEQRKVTEITDMVMTVPNLITMSCGSPALNFISIRGILTFTTDPAIGVYIDDVPTFDGYGISMQLQDIERVEVLRGPQSTLYGRNALGGVINILTKQPGNTLRGFAETGMGNYNAKECRTGISVPLIKDKLFASLNNFYTDRKGLYTNEYTGKYYDDYKNYGGNFYLKYLANNRLSFVLNSKLEKNDIKGAFPFANKAYAFEKPYTINQDRKNIENRTLSKTSLQAKYQLSNWALSSLTGYSYLEDTYDEYDYDFSPYNVITWYAQRPQRTWTQEFKIVSRNLRKWDITGGLFGFIDNREAVAHTAYGEDAVSNNPNAPCVYSTQSTQKTKGFAAYAHLTYSFTDKLKLTGGLRYDYEEKKLILHDEYKKEPNPVQVFPSKTASTSANAISPKANLSYLASDGITLYANYAKGFRPGGVNQYASTSNNYLTFEPEYTNNYEIGIKTEWLKRRLRANFTAFYTHWKDQQQTLMTPEMRIANIGEMYSRGLELELTGLLVKNLEIRYNFGLVNTKYNKLLLLDETGTNNVNYKGNKQVFTPDLSSALSVTYWGKISKNVGFFVLPEWKYLGKQYMTYYNDLVQNPFHLVNVNAGIKYKYYEFKLWAKNIMDNRYISFAYANYRGNNSPILLGLPTTYGVSAKVSF